MKNKELKELIENKAKQLKEELFNVYDVYDDDNSDGPCLLASHVVKANIAFMY